MNYDVDIFLFLPRLFFWLFLPFRTRVAVELTLKGEKKTGEKLNINVVDGGGFFPSFRGEY